MVADEAQETPKKSGMFKWLIIILLLMILAVGGFIAYKMFLSGPSSSTDASESSENADSPDSDMPLDPGEAPNPDKYFTATLPTFLVNLKDPLGRRYLKLTMELELYREDDKQLINDFEAKIVDAIIMKLSSKTYAELSTYESKISLKEELKTEIDRVLGGKSIKDIFFTEMVIQ